jgi:hypothetical protein
MSAREIFAVRTSTLAAATKAAKLTKPQVEALRLIDTHGTAPIAPGSVINDAMFSRLEGKGMVAVDLSKPHRARLTDLGMRAVRNVK